MSLVRGLSDRIFHWQGSAAETPFISYISIFINIIIPIHIYFFEIQPAYWYILRRNTDIFPRFLGILNALQLDRKADEKLGLFSVLVVVCFALFIVSSCVFTLLVPCCDIRYDFRQKTMISSSLPPVVCRRVHVLFVLFVLLCIVVSYTTCLHEFHDRCHSFVANHRFHLLFKYMRIVYTCQTTMLNFIFIELNYRNKRESMTLHAVT